MSLTVQNLQAHYGKSHILQDVSFSIGDGEIVTLLGRNGAGKTTTMRTIAGLISPSAGSLIFNGKSIAGQAANIINRAGIALVPEHRGIFSGLTVQENLAVAARKGESDWTIERIYRLFPRLDERRATGGGKLSGGEQQMLSIGRALLTHPRLLLLDEPTEGLAPVIVKQLVGTFKSIRNSGISILLVEQNLKVCAELADRHNIIELGRTVFSGTFAELSKGNIISRYLGVEV